MTTSRDPLVEVRGLSVTFDGGRRRAPVPALGDVSLTVGAGERVAVVGPSGCGKSTLLRLLAGLPLPGAHVSADALHVPRGADGRPATAWMPQGDSLLPWRRALPNAVVGARISGVPRAVAAADARALFDEFGLAGFERAWPGELSGGMRQRLALLRTCLPRRPLLLLDEPFGALDALTRRRMNAWLAGLDLAGAAVVLVTHDVDEAVTLAQRVLVLTERPGRVLLDVPVARTSADAARALLLDALGVADARPGRSQASATSAPSAAESATPRTSHAATLPVR